jgi:lipopolysaccharide export LptBFGC system permease protein LptF
VVAFCFVVSQQWMEVLVDNSYLHPVIAAWAPDGFFGILGIILLFREE